MIGRNESAAVDYSTGRDVVTPTYYDYPSLKEPSWRWEVVLYFFLGGLAAGSYLVATLVDLFGHGEHRSVSRAGRYISLASVLACPILLVADLGRPERFPNMLRIVKTRSPMSMGSWALTGFGFFAGLGVLRQMIEDGVIHRSFPLARLVAWLPLSVSGVLGGLFAFFVGSYTGVLLSFTNVPVWAKSNLFLGPLFLTSALSTGLASISLALGLRGGDRRDDRRWLGRLETIVSLGELGLIAATVANLGRLARPLARPGHGLSLLLGAVGLGILTPLILRLSPDASQKKGHPREVTADVATLVGGLALRAAALYAGRDSARDPRQYFAFARNRRRRQGDAVERQ